MENSKKRFKLSSIVLIVSITLVTVVLGVLLDGGVVPEKKEPLVIEKVTTGEDETAATVLSDSPLEQLKNPSTVDQDATQLPPQSNRLEQVGQQANNTIKEAEQLITQADNLIAQAGLPVPAGNTQMAQPDTATSKRLAAARKKLDELKQQ